MLVATAIQHPRPATQRLLLGPFVFVACLVVIINLLARRLWVSDPLCLERWRVMVVDDTCCSEVCGGLNHVVFLHLVYEHRIGAICYAYMGKTDPSVLKVTIKIDSLEVDLFGFTVFLSMLLISTLHRVYPCTGFKMSKTSKCKRYV